VFVAVTAIHKPADPTTDIVAGVPQTTTAGTTVSKTTVPQGASIDAIIVSFTTDADTEASLANAEAQDDAALQAQLQDYSDIKTYEI
jgi:hypothetical protein